MDNKLILFSAAFISPLIELLEKYIFGDWVFVKYLIVLMVLDSILGFTKHWIAKDVSSQAWGMVAKKIIIYASVLIVAHVLSTFQIGGEPVDSFRWFRYVACSALIIREAVSIIENAEEILPGLFPKWIISRLKWFDDNWKKEVENES